MRERWAVWAHADRRNNVGSPRLLLLLLFWMLSGAAPNHVRAQDRASDIDEAIAWYHRGQPAEAVIRLRALVVDADTIRVAPQVLSKAYTYLAMSTSATDQPIEASMAVVSAVRTDAATFVTVADAWARQKVSRAVIDSAMTCLLNEAVAAYNRGRYTVSVRDLEAMVALEDLVDPNLAARIHIYLAFNYVATRQPSRASDAFRAALQLDRNLTLGEDAVIAPKIRRVFVQTRRETLEQMRKHERVQTFWRSCLIPGWGQRYRGDRLKGYGFMAAQVGILTGMAIAINRVGTARNGYVNFGVDDAVAIYAQRQSIEDLDAALHARFDTYRTSLKQANVMIGLAIGLWGVNMLDALLLSGRKADYSLSRRMDTRPVRMAMTWDPTGRRWTMGYQLRW